MTSWWIMSQTPPKSTIAGTFAGAVQITQKFDKPCKMVFSKTYKKTAVSFSNLTERDTFLCSSRWVIDDWLISSLWELSSQGGVEYINMTIQREEFSDKKVSSYRIFWMAILREKREWRIRRFCSLMLKLSGNFSLQSNSRNMQPSLNVWLSWIFDILLFILKNVKKLTKLILIGQ